MNRRHFIGLASLALLPETVRANVKRTPSQIEGPYYPVKPIRLGGDLVLDEQNIIGKPMHLHGQVLNQDGQPQSDIKVEIWQCDGAKVYAHPKHPRSASFDSHFAGSGAVFTDAQGRYEFRTLYPVPYPSRPPHIHVKLWRGQNKILTSQLYLQGQTGTEWFGNKRAHLQISPTENAQNRLVAEFTFVV